MKQMLLSAGILLLSYVLKAQTFDNVFFKQNFQYSNEVSDYIKGNTGTTYNNSANLGAFYASPLGNPSASVGITVKPNNQLFSILRPLTTVGDNRFGMLRKFNFSTAPTAIMLKFTLIINSNTPTPSSGSVNMFGALFVQVGDNGSVITETNPGIQTGTVLMSLPFTSVKLSTGASTYRFATPTNVSGVSVPFTADSTAFQVIVNNSANVLTYTNPLGNTETNAAYTYDVYAKTQSGTLVKYCDDLALASNTLTFGSLKFSSYSPSYPTGVQVGCDIHLDNIELSTIGNVVFLPIKLKEFKGIRESGAINLKWSTTTELNIVRFEVLRSSDGQNFASVTSLTAVGNSTEIQPYNWQDNSPGTGTTYYKLKQYDCDGAIFSSNVITIN
ncbi:hypothetical protein SAMN04487898_1015 [Pedobacter sp. ok626]|uniref:hypothetical protein n=1 Tax=Pedobacter sp. ok626 TaxID=1761882 RepID=UPI000882E019|nr:hypothetical protein [Pedobacter sp. ok626]SDI98553.1 hypothetical protein SAMN04487898_1015 [Pedobacter sp. ok626]